MTLGAGELHPIIVAAGVTGLLPQWARPGRRRVEHMERVAKLMDGWATELGLPERDRIRWRAAARLHDALKESDPDELRSMIRSDWPDQLLHGPGCAHRLREAGVRDEGVLRAITYHSVGHTDLERVGRFLYLADFLEPGRKRRRVRRERLRSRLPGESESVLREVAGLRIRRVVEAGLPVLTESVEFWNWLVRAEG